MGLFVFVGDAVVVAEVGGGGVVFLVHTERSQRLRGRSVALGGLLLFLVGVAGSVKARVALLLHVLHLGEGLLVLGVGARGGRAEPLVQILQIVQHF